MVSKRFVTRQTYLYLNRMSRTIQCTSSKGLYVFGICLTELLYIDAEKGEKILHKILFTKRYLQDFLSKILTGWNICGSSMNPGDNKGGHCNCQ